MTLKSRLLRIYDGMRPKGYWDRRYRRGGTSGAGSVGESRNWKWVLIERYAGKVDEVVDVGCGDLSFWEGRDCEKYTGIEISEYIVEKNRAQRPSWNFVLASADKPLDLHAKVVICMDLLFHIPDDRTFSRTLLNLASYSNEWLFIHTWAVNPMKHGRSDFYQKFREFRPEELKGFHPLAAETNPFSPSSKMFVLRRNGSTLDSEANRRLRASE